MNFQQCRYVEVVARVGSFSQAAKELYMTQPNLSCSIKDLENELGVQLFTRSNTGTRLTEDGHDFLKYAKRIIGELDLLQQRMTNSKRALRLLLITMTSYQFPLPKSLKNSNMTTKNFKPSKQVLKKS